MPLDGQADAFELDLRRDLPRGQERRPQAAGRERNLGARWLAPEEMTGKAWAHQAGGLILGRRAGRVIGWNDDRHLLTIAGSRAGKGVSLIIPNLIAYEGSAVVIDPKGENAARTARHRGAGIPAGGKGLGQKVCVLDPYGESKLASDKFNPLKNLNANDPDVVEQVGVFADALITHYDRGERHWTDSAQALVRALIMVVLIDNMFDGRRDLVTMRQLLTLSDEGIDKVIERQFASDCEKARENAIDDHEDPVKAVRKVTRIKKEAALILILSDQTATFAHICTGMAAQLESMGEKERGSVFSAARTQTQWLDSPKMQAILTDSSFTLDELTRQPMTLYLCLPASRMGTHARWLRLMIMLAMAALESAPKKPKKPVLFVLDEFAVLGYMQSIETAAGLMAGYGVKLWPILQNIGQLMRHYPQTWQTFVANAGCVTAFNVADDQSLKELARFIGNTGIVLQVPTGATRSAEMQGTPGLREDRRTVPLLAADEIRLMFGRDTKRLLVLAVEQLPAVVERFVYHATDGPDRALFGGRFDPDPDYATTS